MTKKFDLSSQPAASALQTLIPSKVVLPGDERYDAARRVWNRAADHHPAMITYCETTQDVQAALYAARDRGLPISVRGAGYDGEGRSVRDKGLVVDVSRMNQVEVSGGIATVAGGATAGAVISAAAASDHLAVTGWMGVIGMAGLTLSGGYGPLIASHGLALDSLVGAELILADGEHVIADPQENPDLLWALRGGGGNFGVVTAMKFRLHPNRAVLAGMILFPWSDAARVLRDYAEIAASAGDDLTVLAGMFCLPDGSKTLFLAPAWTGDAALGESLMASLQSLGTPFHVHIDTVSYQDLIRSFDHRVVDGRGYAVKNRWLPEMTQGAISAIIEASDSLSSPFTTIILHHFRGAATRVPDADTAFGLRREHFLVEIIAAWDPAAGDNGSRHRSWARNLSTALAPFALPGGYPSLLGLDDIEQIGQAYGASLQRLQAVKRRFDHRGLFSAAHLPT
ncbi:FAD-binding oxidoreductase [Rhizobium sp. BK251]|uniref:FAD-binding oxidoreductase n=1 Tax=Rhizobium sp. BK251 TaxID=2512125 RepID=UPI0010451530|nr:FAD-binding oxidoreductase [Rhizobium sp. BK251]TCL67181.1 FAD/FMN-containing dehydrogenase [Rhizobium sp. BK251]